jgi:hypothetical protein
MVHICGLAPGITQSRNATGFISQSKVHADLKLKDNSRSGKKLNLI